ncbi:MAG: type IV pilus twitching motility protein PilT [Candidatus Caldatribacteriota bacterium]|nr:type IV pilus twitching motility protein PilT [Atribacterota bacterium]MDD3031067.1 type IV pilus twitching motility protein PilT [Atribacterota bacterium]MDD3640651.1 type IV pilus twitching motility protein PilT [Atribacterota bacterium]MDD4289298.1 type IV pilus twitching motility protein PilT [Atribacterota bacterium]MDD4764937.1 type IV pilus twitching motility protein PilT [Atribacterota bacterium]
MDYKIQDILIQAKEKGASDVHLNIGIPPVFRLNGKMTKTEFPVLKPEDVHKMIYSIIFEKQKKDFEKDKQLDFSYEIEGVSRFRINIFRHRLGEAAVIRLIPTEILSVEQLGLPDVITTLTEKDKGIVLVTGPTGSGKSTTLAALIDIINIKRYEHIISIEDPIEFIHQHKNCVISQREIGEHADSFASALRVALREDPDVILVGEMRDLETISMALRAAETGHLVFSTLHTNSAADTIERIINAFPAHQQGQARLQLAGSIEAVIAQTLIPTADGQGRIAAMELMLATPAIRNLIRDEKIHQIPSTIQISRKIGMQSLDQSLKDLLMQGKITREAAIKKALNKNAFIEYAGL